MLDGRWRASVERGLEPVGRGLGRAGISADGLTVIGLVFAVGTAFAIADGRLVLGVIGIVLTGLPDILDGSVARTSGKATPRGAFFDSVCDRVADAAIFCGVAWYLAGQSPRLPVLVLAVLALSMLITYERARAESLGFTARGGLMERAERMVLLAVGLAFDILVPDALGHARAHRLHRGAAVREGLAPGNAGAAASYPAPAPLRSRRGARRHARTMVGGAPSATRSFPRSLRVFPSHLTTRPVPFAQPVANRTSYYAYRAGAEVARLLPEPLGAPLARGLAQVVGVGFMGARSRQVQRNLARVHGMPLPPGSRTRAVAATFDSYGRYYYELFRLRNPSAAWLDEHALVTGFEHVRAAIHEGKGAIVALPHLGNWDFAGAWLAAQDVGVTVVAEPVEPPELFDWFVRARAALGMRVIPLSSAAGGEVLRALRANEVVCLLCDRDLTGDGAQVEFFGERTTLPGGPALMALRSGAPLIPAGCYFLPRGRHELRILPPVPAERTGKLRDDVARVTQAVAHQFEDLIRVAPEHWHLMQPNWPSDRL